ncbi:anthrone oxygenase family protein [Herbiconiux sp. P17]|uniref:anthrone oxygenase family protein n=1 Tax=Herbiconiux wuyangfengii TaxID=3342794 RepID=UPI0035B8C486
MTSVLAIITTTVVGLMVGVEFSVAFVINPIMVRLPAGPSIAARADGGRMLGRVMPFWYIGSFLLTVALAVATWGTTTATTALVAAVLLAASVVMSLLVLVPINNRSKTWTAESHPDDWREQQQRWDRLHYARVALIVAAFALVAVAATLL